MISYINKLIFPAGIAFSVIQVCNEKCLRKLILLSRLHQIEKWPFPLCERFRESSYFMLHSKCVILGNKEYRKVN